jgi:hypothetical protein
MRTLHKTLASLGILATAGMMHLTGCSNDAQDCTLSFEPCDGARDGGGDSGVVPQGCEASPKADPGVIQNKCGVFVSASMGNDAGDGTREKPFKTLAAAAARAKTTSLRVYACGEAFTGEEVVLDGVSLFGALDCTSGWTYKGDDQRTTIQPGADKIPLRVIGAGGVLVENVTAEAAAATVAGGSSIATIVEGGTVEFARCEIYAGNAQKGEDGAAHLESATSGPGGEKGTDACVLPGLVKGGAGGQATCTDGTSAGAGGIGGKGGIAAADNGGDGEDGLPLDPASGQGGPGAGNGATACVSGTNGTGGESGGPGLGATGIGTISAVGYTGSDGQPGTNGKPGQGGGGGGGSKAGTFCSGVEGPGASGGGGGAGGCGGLGGNPGKGGGSSIALISLNAQVKMTSTNLRAGNGGAGGAGGAEQGGGQGGQGALGGTAPGNGKPGCPGGFGGSGGAGGPGGGGSGGHSIGIAFTGTSPEGASIESLGNPGSGGAPAPGAPAEGEGADGQANNTVQF